MPNVVKPNAAEILESYLQDHGISKSFVAKKLGVTPQAVYNKISLGKIDADFAFKVADILNLDPKIFLDPSYTKRLK